MTATAGEADLDVGVALQNGDSFRTSVEQVARLHLRVVDAARADLGVIRPALQHEFLAEVARWPLIGRPLHLSRIPEHRLPAAASRAAERIHRGLEGSNVQDVPGTA